MDFLQQQAEQARLNEAVRKTFLERQATEHATLDSKNRRVNYLLVAGTFIAAFAAWWAALHPTAIPRQTARTGPSEFRKGRRCRDWHLSQHAF